MDIEELLRSLNRLSGKYQKDVGIVIWGQVQGAPAGTYAKILVDADGTLRFDGTTTISGTVDVSDRWTRQLGEVDLQRYLGLAVGVANPLHSQIVVAGAVIDPRITRALTSADIVTVNNLLNPQPVSLTSIPNPSNLDVALSTRALESGGNLAAILAQLDSKTSTLFKSGQNIGNTGFNVNNFPSGFNVNNFPSTYDVLDRAARLLGVVYGSQGQQLLQRASTYELLVTLRQAGSELSTSNPIFAGIVDASGNRLPSMDAAARRGYVTVTDGTNTMPTMDASARAGYVDAVDRAARLLGVVYGSQGQQLQQKASTYELLVDPVDRAARLLGVVYGSQGQQLKQNASTYELVTDTIDRAGRLLGKVYGNQDVLQQRATTKELLVEISYQGTEKDPTQIRVLTSSDIITAYQITRTNLTVKPEREDLISLVAQFSPSANGVVVVAGTGGQKIKVFDCAYEAAVAGLHYFYFGTVATGGTVGFAPRTTAGPMAQTFPNPHVSALGDNLYIWSTNSDANMLVAVHYIKE